MNLFRRLVCLITGHRNETLWDIHSPAYHGGTLTTVIPAEIETCTKCGQSVRTPRMVMAPTGTLHTFDEKRPMYTDAEARKRYFAQDELG